MKDYLQCILDPQLLEDTDSIPVRFIYDPESNKKADQILGCMFHQNVTSEEITRLLNITKSTLVDWIFENLTDEYSASECA